MIFVVLLPVIAEVFPIKLEVLLPIMFEVLFPIILEVFYPL